MGKHLTDDVVLFGEKFGRVGRIDRVVLFMNGELQYVSLRIGLLAIPGREEIITSINDLNFGSSMCEIV